MAVSFNMPHVPAVIISCTAAALLLIRPEATLAGRPGPCEGLMGVINAAPPGAVFLPSFPTVTEGPLQKAAFTYDQAVAAIALVG